MSKKPTKPDESRQKAGAKALRNETIIGMAMAGKKTQAIADEVGVARQTVSVVLNSDRAKDRVADINERLSKGIDDAILTVLMKVQEEYIPARDLLRNFGAMKEQVEHAVSESLAKLMAGTWEEKGDE